MLEQIELKDAPEILQDRVKQKLDRYEGDGKLLKVAKTNNAHYAYMNAGNLCVILTVWNFNQEKVNEDVMTVGDIKQFLDHPEMQWWFS